VEESVTMASPRIFFGMALAAAFAAAPGPASASAPAPAHADANGRAVVLSPLFDTNQRFKPKKKVLLRFRVQDRATRASLGRDEVAFSLLHGAKDPEVRLTPTKVKNGVFVVPFTPAGPGQYAILVTVRGAKVGSIPPVRLGVVGVADGLTELPPEADAEMQRRAKSNVRSGRTR
jgi:hypothetical protein